MPDPILWGMLAVSVALFLFCTYKAISLRLRERKRSAKRQTRISRHKSALEDRYGPMPKGPDSDDD